MELAMFIPVTTAARVNQDTQERIVKPLQRLLSAIVFLTLVQTVEIALTMPMATAAYVKKGLVEGTVKFIQVTAYQIHVKMAEFALVMDLRDISVVANNNFQEFIAKQTKMGRLLQVQQRYKSQANARITSAEFKRTSWDYFNLRI
jgi:hypothetical protein